MIGVALSLYRVVVFAEFEDFNTVFTLMVLARNSKRAEELAREWMSKENARQYSIVEVDSDYMYERVLGVMLK
ncbi:hypothetical protein [Thermococcus barophilus]|uniref:hypothetical protein n=1 Tax=Thermococcus barophilus TaxID=55802 RepID=UPI00130EF45A|nr:hypothetical protein [Thermococcus barophilus]